VLGIGFCARRAIRELEREDKEGRGRRQGITNIHEI
jgi:hypothetical protein